MLCAVIILIICENIFCCLLVLYVNLEVLLVAIFVTIATVKVKLHLGYCSSKLIIRNWCKRFLFFNLIEGRGCKIAA